MAMVGTARAAKLIGCTRRSVSQWCLEGVFATARRKGRCNWVIDEAEVEAKIEMMRSEESRSRLKRSTRN
jgi:hypothetical protein